MTYSERERERYKYATITKKCITSVMQTYRQLQERNLNKWTSFGTYKTKLVVIDPVHPNMP